MRKGLTARAAEKFKQKQDDADEEELKDLLDNPLTALYNTKHPEVVANA